LTDNPDLLAAENRRAEARRSAFGRKAVRKARSQSATARRGATIAQTELTHYTSTRAADNTRTALVGQKTGFVAESRVAWVRFLRTLDRRRAAVAGWLTGTVTGLGMAIAVVVMLGLVFGYLLGWAELVGVAFAGLVLLLVATLFLLGRNSYDVRLSLNGGRVVVGEPASAQISVHNPSRFRLSAVRAEVPVGEGVAEFALPGLRPKSSVDERFSIPTGRRGVVAVGPVRTVRADPLGLLRREYVWTSFVELFIHPVTIPIPSTSTGLIRDLEGNPTRDLTDSDVSFHALREYAPGDDRRYIHWKSTARTGRLMVRQFEETRRSHLVIALSLASADYHSEEEFELAVSVAGSLGIRAILDARELSVVASEVTPEFARHQVNTLRRLSTLTRSRLLDDLARVDHDALAYRLGDLARISADWVTGISVAFLVCGSEPTARELRAASAKFPAGVEVIAIVCNPGIVPSLRRVGELNVLTIGYLDDLQKSLARAAAA
jgi:uncharacterized protein (DUF58 family)